MKIKYVELALAYAVLSLTIDSVGHNLRASNAPLPGRDDWGNPNAQPPAYHSDPLVRATGVYDRSNVFPHGTSTSGNWTYAPYAPVTPVTPTPAGGGNFLLDFWHWLFN